MTQKNRRKPPKKKLIYRIPSTPLGEAHPSVELTPRETLRMARKFGFSADEVSELERVYFQERRKDLS